LRCIKSAEKHPGIGNVFERPSTIDGLQIPVSWHCTAYYLADGEVRT